MVLGSNGSCATATSCQAAVGYDGPTGIGSPVGLDAFSIPGSPASTSKPTISGVAEQGQTLTATHGVWTNSPTTITDQWEACNSVGADCSTIAGATAQAYTLTGSDVGSTIRVQESASNAAGSGSPTASTQTAIEGTALSGVSPVAFGALPAKFQVLSSTRVEATVPNGAVPDTVSVTAPLGGATSATQFTPTFSVTSVKPLSRPPGKPVTIKGVGFNSGSTVSFDGHGASVTFLSSKKLKATVPAGAVAGPIFVTNTAAPVGTVQSASSFTP